MPNAPTHQLSDFTYDRDSKVLATCTSPKHPRQHSIGTKKIWGDLDGPQSCQGFWIFSGKTGVARRFLLTKTNRKNGDSEILSWEFSPYDDNGGTVLNVIVFND